MKHALRIVFGVLCSIVLTGAGACALLGGSSTESSGTGSLEKTVIKAAIINTVDLAPFWLAQEGGYFAREGLTVEPINAPTSQLAMQKVVSGDTDLALTTYTLLFKAQAERAHDFRLVADASWATPRSNSLMTVPSSPVKTVLDLEGKRIGISSKLAASGVLTRSMMKDQGLDVSTVQWIETPLPNMAAGLKSGDLDAAYQPEPFLTQSAKAVGATTVIDVASGSTQDFPLTGYAASATWTTANPKTMAAFQRAMLAATRDASDRSKIEPLIVKHNKVDAETAALITLPGFGSTLDARRIQRVPDLMVRLGLIASTVDAAPMIAPRIAG